MRGFRLMVEVVEADGVVGKAEERGVATAVAGGVATAAGVRAEVAVPGAWPLRVRLSVERCTPSVCEEAMADVRTLSGVGCVLV